MYSYTIETTYPYWVAFLIVLDMLFCYKLFQTPGFSKKERWIANVIVFGIFCAISDILCVVLPIQAGRFVLYLVNASYYYTFASVCFMLLRYCEINYTDSSQWARWISTIPAVAFDLLLVVSYWTGWFFQIDSTFHFQKGPLYSIVYILMAMHYWIAILGVSFRFWCKEKDSIKKKILAHNISYGVVVIAGIALQLTYPSLPFVTSGLTIMNLLIFTDNEERLYHEAVDIKVAAIREKELLDMQAKIAEKNAEMDGLTQIYNRASGEKHVNQLLQEGRFGMFCMFDVDDFKLFNDMYGHLVGDEVLRNVAKCMKNTFREHDILIRLGGDEFAVYAPDLIDSEVAAMRIHKLIEQVSALRIENMQDSISISVGMTNSYESRQKSFEELFKETDTLMYAQKHTHKSIIDVGRYEFEELSKEMPVAFLVYEAVGKERIRFASHTLIQLFECESDEEFMQYTKGTFRGLVHPDDLQRVEKEIVEQIQTSQEEKLDYVEYRIITKKGNIKSVLDYGRLVDSTKYGRSYFVMIAEKTK